VVPTAQRRALLRGGIFDAGWYAAAYPASGADGADPARRYLVDGARRGHRPHPLFDPAWVRASCRGVSGNPVLGYQDDLAPPGPDPSAWLDVAWVLASGFQRTPGRTLLATWLAADPTTRPSPCSAIDPDWYRTAYPDVAQAGVDPALHLAASGAADGRSPGPVFDSALYRACYPDVRAGDWTAWEHYRAIGAGEGRAPHRAFDPDWYARRPEAAGVGRADLFAHYARHGRTGWHSPHPTLPAPGSSTGLWSQMPWTGHIDQARSTAGRTVLVVAWRGERGSASDELDDLLDGLVALSDSATFVATIGAEPPTRVAGLRLDARSEQPDPRIVLSRLLRALALHDPWACVVALQAPSWVSAEAAEIGLDAVEASADLASTIAAVPSALPPPASPLTVTAIVPAYNHATYLDERIGSILTQTRPVAEIIVLDDASTDGSAERLAAWQARSPVPFRLVVNAANSGSTFRQWQAGLALAASDLVWFAESDDSCAPDLLARLVPAFRDPEVVLSYAESAVISPDGGWRSDSYRFYTDDLDPRRWEKGYVVEGSDEIEDALAIKNTIPNASAALFRRGAITAVIADAAKRRYCGDWAAYLGVLQRGRVAYHAEALNRHRQSDGSVTRSGEAGETLAREAAALRWQVYIEGHCSHLTALRGLVQGLTEAALRSVSLSAALPLVTEGMEASRDRLVQAWPDTRETLRKAAAGLVGRTLDGEAANAVVRDVETTLDAWLAAS